MQKIISGTGSSGKIKDILKEIQCRKFMLVCDSCFDFLAIKDVFENTGFDYVKFSDFQANPLYEQVAAGVDIFNGEGCDAIVAVGGGSAIDVAKCIKLYCKMKGDDVYLKQEYSDTKVPLIAVPTTAGTGSESTRFAVIYYEGAKQSVAHISIIPDYAVLDPVVLKTVPVYQKKCTLMDALCQAIESFWSVNSNDESKGYSKAAIELIVNNYKAYVFENDSAAAEEIMTASNLAGRAINITQTTAAHAMSYKMTSIFGLPHGHAVAAGLPFIFEYMIENTHDCLDSRGSEYLEAVFGDIAKCLGQNTPTEAVAYFREIMAELELSNPLINDEELLVLTKSVNPTRLSNNPVKLDENAIFSLYRKIGGYKDEA